jgi:hypothetical protein
MGELKARSAPLEKELAEARAARQTADAAKEAAEAATAVAVAAKEHAEMEVAEMNSVVAAKTAINQDLATQHSVLTTEYEASQKRVEVLTQQAHQWNEEVGRLKKAVEAAEARVGDASQTSQTQRTPCRNALSVWWACEARGSNKNTEQLFLRTQAKGQTEPFTFRDSRRELSSSTCVVSSVYACPPRALILSLTYVSCGHSVDLRWARRRRLPRRRTGERRRRRTRRHWGAGR